MMKASGIVVNGRVVGRLTQPTSGMLALGMLLSAHALQAVKQFAWAGTLTTLARALK